MLWAIPLWLFKLIITVSGKPTSSSSQFAGPSFSSQDRDIVDVKLYTLGNSTIRAVVTNIGNDHLQLIKSGSILDENRPTRKVSIEGNARFTGVRVDYINSHLSPDAFVYLAPNQTIESVFNVAKFYDLVPGERYYAFASGYLEYIRSTVPNLFSSVAYTSNKVTFDAPRVLNKAITSRATLIACDAQYNDAMHQALDRVAKMAMAAAQEAREGGERLKVYFNSTSPEVRKEVADRLDAIANEANSKGTVNYYCKDTKHECYGNVAALTFPYENRIINCLPYYETPAVTDQCHYLDQAGLSLHEFAHATSVYHPGTIDVAYGYPDVLRLNTQSALHNADSYAYYANCMSRMNVYVKEFY
ncbi:Deuterolysin metalloprotease family-domain-containing protein [Aspergillus novoparasiticus]|uniref:Neutral protease 2 n=1 Tax=Aspergillus novoparasiticus TaxID=986946 RepID=A0A5N6E739_9EURO|nr:Deuterolysin metalloprotease family-domain-containing protein [Aspergillus novoparasiticus]